MDGTTITLILVIIFMVIFAGTVIVFPILDEKYEIKEKEYMQIPEYRDLKQNIKIGTTLVQECYDITNDFTYNEVYVVRIKDSGFVKFIDSNKKFGSLTYRQLYKRNYKIKRPN